MRVAGGPGALLVLESEDAATDPTLWPKSPPDGVEQAQLSLLPPSLPMLPDVRLSGSYHRATVAGAAGGDWYDAVALGGDASRWWWATRSATASRPPAP